MESTVLNQQNVSHTTQWIRHLWWPCARLLCVLFVLGWFAGCGKSSNWQFNLECPVYTQLRDQSAYENASTYDDPEVDYSKQPRTPYRDFMVSVQKEQACLVMRWTTAEGIKQKVQYVEVDSTGAIKALSDTTGLYSLTPGFAIPPEEVKDSETSWYLYMIRRSPELDKKPHKEKCDIATDPKHTCFPDDLTKQNNNPCWFYLQVQPDTLGDESFKVAAVPQRCQICSREICGNKVDDDCDGQTDENCEAEKCHHPGKTRPCYTGAAGTKGLGLCADGVETCQDDLTWSTCEGEKLPGKEVCNGLDDNCDGKTDEGIVDCCVVGMRRPCYDGPAGNAGKGICTQGTNLCTFDVASGGGKWDTNCVGSVLPANKEECNGKDDDCDGLVDNDVPGISGSCSTGLPGDCQQGTKTCQSGAVVCAPNVQPGEQSETCNGKDYDCNGQVDELAPLVGTPCDVSGQKGPCLKGVYTACKGGKLICSVTFAKEAKERCDDGIDNDCDGNIDDKDSQCACKAGTVEACYTGPSGTRGKGVCADGKRTCDASGRWGPCTNETKPTTETCDGKDNDCNGSIDDAVPGGGTTCFVIGGTGQCGYGKYTCRSGKWVCTPSTTKKTESCSNSGIATDDDCDSLIDEGCNCSPNATQSCYRGPAFTQNVGNCRVGQQTCGTNKRWGGCIGEVLPAQEKCDGQDNDCDGVTDEEDVQIGQTCTITSAKGICRPGRKACVSGKIVCRANAGKATEFCNGLDDDCDGQVDETDAKLNTPCTVKGETGVCALGKTTCQGGVLTCTKTTNKSKEICDGKDNDCDGQTDEMDQDSETPPLCPLQNSLCKGATKFCAGAQKWLGACSANDYLRQSSDYEPREKSCDNKDNDCDGKVDSINGAPLSRACYGGAAQTKDIGECNGGTQTCTSGKWGVCVGEAIPSVELCGNQKDDDCDGDVDEASACNNCWGDVLDGELVVSASVVLDTEKRAGKQAPDLIPFEVLAIGKNTLKLQLPSGLPAMNTLLTKNRELMLIHMQGDAKIVGQYEFVKVLSVQGDTVTLQSDVKHTYGAASNSDLAGQAIVAIRVPHYSHIHIQPKGSLTVSPWNGKTGGVLVFRANEYVYIEKGGKIDLIGKGYRGGVAAIGPAVGRAGESISSWPSDVKGVIGGGTAASASDAASSGAGGSYKTAGVDGLDKNGNVSAAKGVVYGPVDLKEKIFLGSGGGAGGPDNADAGKDTNNKSGAGGAGGGAVLFFTKSLNVAGEINAQGASGGDATSYGAAVGGGGGGAGGSVMIFTQVVALYQGSQLTATGGAGGKSASNGPAIENLVQPVGKSLGGQGGDGLIDLRFSSVNGKETTTLDDAAKSFFSPAPFTDDIKAICQ